MVIFQRQKWQFRGQRQPTTRLYCSSLNDSLEGFLAPLAPSAEEEIRQRIVDEVHAAGEL
jgi:hypothetical protein